VTSVKIDDSSAYRAPHIAAFDGASKVKGIEFFITFESKVGSGRGTCRLFEENGKWKIFSFFTSLSDIKGHEEATGLRRPTGVAHGGQLGRKNWVERRKSEQNYDDGREPTVIILGQCTHMSNQSKFLTDTRCRTRRPYRCSSSQDSRR
jgi:hypothetical protein